MMCEYGNTPAVARRIYEPEERVEWVETPDRIHVSPELLKDEEARLFIESTYRITNEWCPETASLHAIRRDA